MAFKNQDYLYQHIPARFRRDDAGLILYRFFQFFGDTLDAWDALYDNFFQQIEPATASEPFINFWLWALFTWSWFPSWYSLDRKRHLYQQFTYHIARRGTPLGIELFLKEFSVESRVWARPEYWGEFVFGESSWTVTGPLGLVVQVYQVLDEVNSDVRGMCWGEMVWGEGYIRDVGATLTTREIEDLVRWEWPQGQRVMVEYRTYEDVAFGAWDSDEPVLDDSVVPSEVGGNVSRGLGG